jgi:hypothetical protein
LRLTAERRRAGYVPLSVVSLAYLFTPLNMSLVHLAYGQCIANTEDKVIHDASVHDGMFASQRGIVKLARDAAKTISLGASPLRRLLRHPAHRSDISTLAQ